MEWKNKKYWHPTGQQHTVQPDVAGFRTVALNAPGIPRKHQHRSKYDPHQAGKETQRRKPI